MQVPLPLLSDDEDDELDILHLYAHALPRHFRDRLDPMGEYDDSEFKARYRLEKEAVLMLLELIENELQTSGRNRALSPLDQLLLTLRFFATSSFQAGFFIVP